MPLTRSSSDVFSWWSSLNHGGLLISPQRLGTYFPDPPAPLPSYIADRLRRDLNRLDGGGRNGTVTALLDTVLDEVCGLGDGSNGIWLKGPAVTPEWSHRALTGEIVKPRRVWSGPRNASLPIFVDDETQRLGIGRGKRLPARVIEWLRATDRRLALLTNARQWRLIYAGLDHDAFAQWDVESWFEEGRPGDQIDALRILLSPRALTPPTLETQAPLLSAILESRKGQAELSSALGERVRQAVEILIQSHGDEIASLVAADPNITAREIYVAATRIIMRMVVLLFAESRPDLLPLDNPIYHDSYGLQALREALGRVGGGARQERLRNLHLAWPRILALFRLIHDGSGHPALPVIRYGGELFRPGDPASRDPRERAMAIFEKVEPAPTDAAVHRILELLCTCPARVRQGRAATTVTVPVDFSDLSTAYIGILYEGLLDFELRRADDAIVFLAIGDEPALPLSRLEAMDDRDLGSLVEKFKQKASAAAVGEESEEGGEEEDEETSEEDEAAEELEADTEQPLVAETSPVYETDADARQQADDRALAWGRRAVRAGKLVRRTATDFEIIAAARGLVSKTVLAGEWYLVRWGGTRKGSGTFYTRPELAVPTVQRTLRPLAFDAPLGDDGRANEDAPPAEWVPKKPEEILTLKMCDPACGSGSFLVGSLRFLTEALYRSLHHHGRIQAREGDRTLVTLAEGQPSAGHLTEEYLPCRPDDPDFEIRLRARLKRYIVERCIYGVDLDPLAIELARLTLWIETMDRALPFSFLDHKIRCGNSLVGCWFDRFRDYPALAWEREGGDKGHRNGVHFKELAWTKAIKDYRNKKVKHALADWIRTQSSLFESQEDRQPEALHDQAVELIGRMHDLPVHETEERARLYRDEIVGNSDFLKLREAFDTWCALWFWPADRLDDAPLPKAFAKPAEAARAIVRTIAGHHRFFHWEIEFPDVFVRAGSGFDAVMGNPPWEIQKPNSKEFFSNIDPLYRTYGKQDALLRQNGYFQASETDERAWLTYCAEFKAKSNFSKNAASPFGDGADDGETFNLGSGSADGHERWRQRRSHRHSYADAAHPYRWQGSADINTYKMFLEVAHSLLRQSGLMGLIVPSGLYSDKGSAPLRELFLYHCRLRYLFGFINWKKIFNIYYRFKFCIVIIQKAGSPGTICFAANLVDIEDWEDADKKGLPLRNTEVARFSPRTFAILELRNRRDLEILEKIYANSVLLGDTGPDGWGIKYAREFDMTNDSHLFKPRPWWEDRGYRSDEYGRWVKWRDGPDLTAPDDGRWWDGGWLRLRNGGLVGLDDVEDLALPLYEGRMIGQFDFSQKGWVSGKGRTAVWREIPWQAKVIEPQYLVGQSVVADRVRLSGGVPGETRLKVSFLDVTSATNARTMVATVLGSVPCGNSVPVLSASENPLSLLAILNSLTYDAVARSRCGGLHLNNFVIAESALPQRSRVSPHLGRLAARLALPHESFAAAWQVLSGRGVLSTKGPALSWRRHWAVLRAERLRITLMIESLVAHAWGLDLQDLLWLVRGCDHPRDRISSVTDLEPKGFWRVDKDLDPELRHTVLAVASYSRLLSMIGTHGGNEPAGIEAYCGAEGDEGWLLPETLALSTLGLGRDLRSREEQPVASRIGERLLGWQLGEDVRRSWMECQVHAEIIRRSLGQ